MKKRKVKKRIEESKLPAVIVVGQHGDGSLKEAVIDYLTDNRMDVKVDSSNEGSFLLIFLDFQFIIRIASI